MASCDQEMCPRWSGDGNVCPGAVLGIERPPVGEDDLGHEWMATSGPVLSQVIDYAVCARCLVRSDRPEAETPCDASWERIEQRGATSGNAQ